MYKLYIIGRYLSSSDIRYDIRFEIDDDKLHRFHWLTNGYDGEKYYVEKSEVVQNGTLLKDLRASASYNGFTISDSEVEERGATDLGHGAYLGTGNFLNYGYSNPIITIVKNSNHEVGFTANTFEFFKEYLQIYGDVEVVIGEMHYTLDGSDPKERQNDNIVVDNQIISISDEQYETYEIKIKYFTFRYKANPNGQIYTITNDTPDHLVAPILDYVSEENPDNDYITVVSTYPDTSEVVTEAYSQYGNTTLNRHIDNGKIFISTLVDFVSGNTSFPEFVKRYNIYAYNKTSVLTSPHRFLDLFLCRDKVVNITPVVKSANNFVSFDIDDCLDERAEAYYTLDGSVPSKNGETSIKYEGPFQVSKEVETIKVIYYIERISTNVKSFPFTFNTNPEIIEYGEPNIVLKGSENVPLAKHYIKRYVDIICNAQYNNPKVLESISYILNKIESEYDSINVSEEYLNRRFSGNKLTIYSDECYTGVLTIQQDNIINKVNEFRLPFWDKGKWNFNYFRDDITKDVTLSELIEHTFITYYNSKTGKNEIRHVDLAKMKKANLYNPTTQKAALSDNRTLMFGKYFVVRFIFDARMRYKFEELTFNLNQY